MKTDKKTKWEVFVRLSPDKKNVDIFFMKNGEDTSQLQLPYELFKALAEKIVSSFVEELKIGYNPDKEKKTA